MSELFLKIVNMSISASWLVLVVMIFRVVFKKVPKWVNVLLWGFVAVRLLCPFSIESALSLIPSAETISPEIMMDWTPEILTGMESVDSVVNPIITETFAPEPIASANPLQILIPICAIIWIVGMCILALYTAVSYWCLQRKVSEAVILRENIFQSENVGSPFVLGIIRPRIYLPYNMDAQDLSHVVAHEQAHIRRRDHWWKPLGFLLLTIHWFNPLMWLAYVLLCRDIELACDEKVIEELGNEQRADYSQALVACSVNRRMIAACPLAFGEVGVKERVKSVMNYKKPAFWVIVVSVIACVVVAVCFLTDPAAKREFPINGSNVSELDTAHVVEMIAKAEKLEDGSQLCVNADNFDLMFTSDFNWANDGAIRFFYMKDQNTYSAQLRMFHEDNKYFITDSDKWIEQEQIFKLFHYLDALKYMPQEEIRQLSPDADGYSVMMRHEGAPSDYDRVLKYSRNGVNANDGWYIHLEVQPLHEAEGGSYNGIGDEVIHLFYNSGDKRDDIAGKTYLYDGEGIGGSFTITLYEDGTFTYYEGMLSSYIGNGTFMLDGDTVIMTDDGHGGYGLVNHFKREGDDLVFVEQDSDNFIYVKVKDGEKFHCTGEAFKINDGLESTATIVTKWFDYLDNPSEMERGLTTELPDYPGVTFEYTGNQIIASKPFDNSELTGNVILIGGMPIWNAYFTDLTGDGLPDLCSTYTYGSGIIDSRVIICDYANGASYELSDRGNYDYTLRLNESDGQLYVDKRVYPNGELVSSGRLAFRDDCIQIEGNSSESDLDAAISKAILDHYASDNPDGLIHVESHVLLANETMSGTPLIGADNHMEKTTVYLLVFHEKYSTYGGELEAVGGSYVPTAITFTINDTKEYVLEEYWEPRDGGYYVDDIRDKFPGSSADDALNDQAYIEELEVQNYGKALSYMNSTGSLDTQIAELFDAICASPGTFSSNPDEYLETHEAEYQELLSFGEYTLRYCFSEFLRGGQTDLRGQIMALVCQDIMLAWGEGYAIDWDPITGQDWFDSFRNSAESLANQFSDEELEKSFPGSFLLLQLIDNTDATKDAQQ